MAGAFKKTMIYLGLADGDDYREQESFGSQQENSPARTSSSPSSQVAPAAERPAAEPVRPAASSPVTSAPGAAPSSSPVPADSAHGGEVLQFSGPVQQDQGAEGSFGQSNQYNSSNLAVDPEYRAPVTPIKRAPSSRDESSPMRKITTVHPRSYNDAKVIGESFRDGIPVIMNVTDMGEAEAKRLVDFSAGLVFGLSGSIERVTNKVFLLTPKNVEVLAEERAAAEPSTAQFFNQS